MTYFKKMLRFMKPYMALFLIGNFLYGSNSFAVSFMMGLIGHNVMAGIMTGAAREIVNGIIVAAIVFVGLWTLVGIGIYLTNRAGLLATMDLKRTLFRCFVRTSLEASQASHSGEGIAAINTDASTASELFSYAFNSLLRPTITVTLSTVLLFVLDWRIGFAGVGLGLFAYLVQSRFIKPVAKIGKERLEANADSVKAVSDIFQGAMSIRAFNMQDRALERAGTQIERMKMLDFRQAFISMWQNLFTTVQGWLALAVTFGFGGWLVATERLNFPVLLLILPLTKAITESMGRFGNAIADMQPPIEAAKRVFAIIDNAPVSTEKGNMDFDGACLKIRDLSFKYQNAKSNTLHDINLDIKTGEMVAFVGPSGSGKSTILRVIVGFYERENFGMTLGGTTSDSVGIMQWRKQFAYVDQSCKLFDMTIRENIAFGRRGPKTDEDITTAAKHAFAHDFIEQLDEKYDTPCGEKGASLSGGQKQRVAIARALIKDSPILVFDEATSALDAESERNVMDTIESLRQGHTILITTHNLENTKGADKIVVMDGGRIAEVGKHEELLAKKGIYFGLFTEGA